MAQKTREDLKAAFVNGAKPSQDDFADVFDSFVSQKDINVDEVNGAVSKKTEIRVCDSYEELLRLDKKEDVIYLVPKKRYETEGKTYCTEYEKYTYLRLPVSDKRCFQKVACSGITKNGEAMQEAHGFKVGDDYYMKDRNEGTCNRVYKHDNGFLTNIATANDDNTVTFNDGTVVSIPFWGIYDEFDGSEDYEQYGFVLEKLAPDESKELLVGGNSDIEIGSDIGQYAAGDLIRPYDNVYEVLYKMLAKLREYEMPTLTAKQVYPLADGTMTDSMQDSLLSMASSPYEDALLYFETLEEIPENEGGLYEEIGFDGSTLEEFKACAKAYYNGRIRAAVNRATGLCNIGFGYQTPVNDGINTYMGILELLLGQGEFAYRLAYGQHHAGLQGELEAEISEDGGQSDLLPSVEYPDCVFTGGRLHAKESVDIVFSLPYEQGIVLDGYSKTPIPEGVLTVTKKTNVLDAAVLHYNGIADGSASAIDSQSEILVEKQSWLVDLAERADAKGVTDKAEQLCAINPKQRWGRFSSEGATIQEKSWQKMVGMFFDVKIDPEKYAETYGQGSVWLWVPDKYRVKGIIDNNNLPHSFDTLCSDNKTIHVGSYNKLSDGEVESSDMMFPDSFTLHANKAKITNVAGETAIFKVYGMAPYDDYPFSLSGTYRVCIELDE